MIKLQPLPHPRYENVITETLYSPRPPLQRVQWIYFQGQFKIRLAIQKFRISISLKQCIILNKTPFLSQITYRRWRHIAIDTPPPLWRVGNTLKTNFKTNYENTSSNSRLEPWMGLKYDTKGEEDRCIRWRDTVKFCNNHFTLFIKKTTQNNGKCRLKFVNDYH